MTSTSTNSLYMFRVSSTPIIRSTQNCNYSLRYCAATSLQRGQASLAVLEGGSCTKNMTSTSTNSLYMFRVSSTPIIRSTQNCNYSLRYWSYFLCSYLPPTWPSCVPSCWTIINIEAIFSFHIFLSSHT